MKLQGLLIATLLSVSLPLAAHAQSSVTDTTTTTTTTTGTAVSTAQEPAISSQEVIMAPTGVQSGYSLPQLSVLPNGNLELHLLNFSDQSMTFSSPDLKLGYVVPANSERVVYIDSATTASLTPGQPVAYYILDPSGNQIASSTIVSQPTIASQLNTSTSVASTEQYSSPVQQRSTVRGYW